VTKRFGSTVALSEVSFDLERGRFVGLLGPNGAGKTTLASLIAGLLAPDSGRIELFGKTLVEDRAWVLERLGMVFQSRSLDLEMSVRANLAFHAALFGLSGRAARARIEELAALLEFEPLLARPVHTLSGGNQRRVEIGRALLNRPLLVLMDEATAGLDPAARPALVEHVHRLCRDQGTSVLWATHLLDEVAAADSLVVLAKGRVLGSGSPDEIVAAARAPDLLTAYIALTGNGRAGTSPADAIGT
jgi:ABC-2 type transport system ATP-binding protein